MEQIIEGMPCNWGFSDKQKTSKHKTTCTGIDAVILIAKSTGDATNTTVKIALPLGFTRVIKAHKWQMT